MGKPVKSKCYAHACAQQLKLGIYKLTSVDAFYCSVFVRYSVFEFTLSIIKLMANNEGVEMSRIIFFTGEVVAFLARQAGHDYRPQADYNNLPNHLTAISNFVVPVVNGVNIFSGRYIEVIQHELAFICGEFVRTPVAERSKFLTNSLNNAFWEMVINDNREERIFAFIRLVTDVCIWLKQNDQIHRKHAAISVLGTVLCSHSEGPVALVHILERLQRYVQAYQDRNI